MHAHVTSSPTIAHRALLVLDHNQESSDPSSALLIQLQQAKVKLEMELADTATDLILTKASLAKEKEMSKQL